MSVYVDKPLHRYGRMIMCHMVADPLGELHEMCKSKRDLAIRYGAVEVSSKRIIEILRRLNRVGV